MVSGHFCSLLCSLSAVWQWPEGRVRGAPYADTQAVSEPYTHGRKEPGLKAQTVIHNSWATSYLSARYLTWSGSMFEEEKIMWEREKGIEWAFLVSSLWVIIQHEYIERKALFKFARPSLFPFSLTLLSPSIFHSSGTWHACRASTQGVEEKQLCSAVINPQDVIHKLFTINSLTVYKCG